MNPNFWRGKKVLITGHTGFQGTWLCLWLQRLGAQLVGFSLSPPTHPSLFEIAEVGKGMASLRGDVRDLSQIEGCFKQHSPEIVIHLAAQSLVLQSYRDPIETFSTNVIGTSHVLEAIRRTEGVRVVVCVTSDKCYAPKSSPAIYREYDPLGGVDPYSASKGAAEIVIASYRSSYFSEGAGKVAVASARAGNVIGGGDWSQHRLVPDVMRAMLEKSPILVRNPAAVRPWQHVLEPLAGYLTLAERLWEQGRDFAEAWNFGPAPESCHPVSYLVNRLVMGWGGETSAWTRDAAAVWHEDDLLRIDSTKAWERLDWRPRLSLDMALEWIVGWYKAYGAGGDMRTLTMEQIETFQNWSVS